MWGVCSAFQWTGTYTATTSSALFQEGAGGRRSPDLSEPVIVEILDQLSSLSFPKPLALEVSPPLVFRFHQADPLSRASFLAKAPMALYDLLSAMTGLSDIGLGRWLVSFLVFSLLANVYMIRGARRQSPQRRDFQAQPSPSFPLIHKKEEGKEVQSKSSTSPAISLTSPSSSSSSGATLSPLISSSSSSTQSDGLGITTPSSSSSSSLGSCTPPTPTPSSSYPNSYPSHPEDEDEELTEEDMDIVRQVESGQLANHALEKSLNDYTRAVRIRRHLISRTMSSSSSFSLASSALPYLGYDYTHVHGRCCEGVVGYMPLPLGIAGPLRIDDGPPVHLPMATTEGCLVASTSRGCKALNAGGGVHTALLADSMTRGPVLSLPTAIKAARVKAWVEAEDEGVPALANAFNSTSRYARLLSIKATVAGSSLYLRFAARTGDAMGMNMISKGVEAALDLLLHTFPEAHVVSISGNYCTDKKPAAINWIDGRGKSCVAEAIIPGAVVTRVLKTTVAALVQLNHDKNLVGSAMAASVGGFNAHAANILTAVFLATGQDPAQNVESSQCITLMKATNEGQDLQISCTMPCIEVGTIGGGTQLPAQAAALDLIGVRGANTERPGANAQRLARVICAAVLAGELSLCSALAAGHLVKSHMAHNRAKPSGPSSSASSSTSTSSTPSTTTSLSSPVVGSCLKS